LNEKYRRAPRCGDRKLMTITGAVNSSSYDPQSIYLLSLGGTALAGAVLGLEPGAPGGFLLQGLRLPRTVRDGAGVGGFRR